ncbi:MAG: hypothetical protein HY902_15500 [Deltaproteobacteria bacterium]|nr:hypothetical protein [Deltaproteobacteria bacterium]
MADPALLRIAWSDPLVGPAQSPEFERRVRAFSGLPATDSVRPLGWAPWLAELSIAPMVRPCTSLDQDYMLLAVLVGAQSHACRFCYGALVAVLRISGIDDQLLLEVEQEIQRADLPAQQRQGLEFVRKASLADPRHSRGPAELRAAGFTAPQVAELTFLVSLEAITSRLATPLALAPVELEAWRKTWWGRLFRPVLAFATRRAQRQHRLKSLTTAEAAGPFAELLQCLAPSPSARLLRRAIDECLASPLCPLRTKVLAMAVVARAAGCSYTEKTARSLCHRAGLDPALLDEVLAHLGSASLSAFEGRAVRYARRSFRYEVTQIQEIARELAQDVEPAVLVDFIGAVALANGLVRLSILLEAQ